MYPYLSLVERKVADFNHNIARRHWLVWSKWLIFITFSGQLMVSLEHLLALTPLWVSVRVYRVQSWANNIWQWSQVYAVLYCFGLQCAPPEFLLDWMTSHIPNKSSSMLVSIQAVSSLGLAWNGNTQLSTEPVCWTERSLSLNNAQTLKDFDLVALLNTTFC